MEEIGFDFEGWAMYKLNLMDILRDLGAEEFMCGDKKVIGFLSDEPFLSTYPTTLEDDGMGYGVRECWITNAAVHSNGKIHIWREPVTE